MVEKNKTDQSEISLGKKSVLSKAKNLKPKMPEVAAKPKRSFPVRPDPDLPNVDPAITKRLQDVIDDLPKEQVDAVRADLGRILSGEDDRWLELFKLTPQELGGIAEEGYLHFKNGRYPTARKVFQGLSIIEPENYYHHSMLGAISQREQKWAEAILEYSISLDMYPEDIATYTNRGECYLRLGFTEEARSDLENAVSRDSNKKNSWANRARLLQKQLEVLEKRLK